MNISYFYKQGLTKSRMGKKMPRQRVNRILKSIKGEDLVQIMMMEGCNEVMNHKKKILRKGGNR
ncbi:hypothetical protein [Clostridium sp. Cult3]|uniref:hypothetical protein n=1 Tax=Clostridium sp. Cult3 TaxID=2079004 RepID=UPI001F18077B|nr:hypothetical protein [Clostridium sp. Cult3]